MTQPEPTTAKLPNHCINCGKKKKHERDFYFETGKKLCPDCAYELAEESVLDGDVDSDDFVL